MKTYVTTYIEGDGSDRVEGIAYAGPSRVEAFSFKTTDNYQHSAKVYVWVLGWEVEVYVQGEEFSSEEWILEYSIVDEVEREINELSKQLDEKKRILNEIKPEI